MLKNTIQLIENVPLPKMFMVRQVFERPKLPPERIPDHMMSILSEERFAGQVKPGMRIAITAGSRGIANVALITKSIVDFVYSQGAHPFVVPAMGSHGNATADGQREVLEGYGITEEMLGCPILSSMEVERIGRNEEGMDVYIDKNAAHADGIIVSCRIKPHTAFRGDFESGIMKMMTIGLGKQAGAEACHDAGFKHMAKYIPMFGKAIIQNAPILFAVAALENAFDETFKIVAVDSDEIFEKEPDLLKEAFANMPKIYMDTCDVLIVDRIGKNFSGGGLDPNITGTHNTPYSSGGLTYQHVAILGVSPEAHGNAMGIGHATATTKRAVANLNYDAMYANGVTCKLLKDCYIPPCFDTDKQAIQVALKLCVECGQPQDMHVIRIPNSLHIEHIMLSEAYYERAKAHPNIIIESEPKEMSFDAQGFLSYDVDWPTHA